MSKASNGKRKFFGTDGIRGTAGIPPLDPESLVRLGKAIALVFTDKKRKHKILIGKDTRLSGYMIETALAAGITSMGVDVELVGPLPTPGVAYLTRSMRVDAGIMISASHNPYEDNGIKIFAADGYKLPDQVELQIEELLESTELSESTAPAGEIGKAHRIDDAVGRYTVYLKGCFPHDLSLNGLRVGFDCANGAGYVVGPQVCEELGATVISRGISPNGRNINSGFGSLYPEIVRELVLERNLNIGISLDGDADRVILTDEKGQSIDGDQVLAICAVYMKEQGILSKDMVVTTVMANLGLETLLKEAGLSMTRVAVGDRYVLEEMRSSGFNLGGEQSGHTIFSDYSTTGDGILTALKVLEIMVRTGKPLSELASSFKRFPQRLINIKVSSKPDLTTLEPVQSAINNTETKLNGRGRVLVRYSGTENQARVMVECDNEEDCKTHAENIAQVIEKEIGAL